MIHLETERLILRNFTEADYDDLYEFLSQRKEDEHEAYPGITYENGREHLSYRVGSDEFAAIERKADHKVIGNIYFGNRDFSAREIGYIVNKDCQRKGYAAEAARALISDAFSKGTHRIYAECAPGNDCSWKFLENLGFSREAHLRKNVYFRTDETGAPLWQDTYVYALLNPAE